MRKWLMIGGAGAVVGYAAVYFALSGLTPAEQEAEPIAVAPQPDEPVVLSNVVEVTNVDPLLDSLPGQPAGVPFDPTEPLEPQTPVNAIPPAAEEGANTLSEVAPMPHEANERQPLDAPRVAWYGDQVIHQQLYDWLSKLPEWTGNGIGFFF